MKRPLVIGPLVVVLLARCSPAQLVDHAKLRAWGAETYTEIERTLRVPGTALYAENAALDGSRSGSYGRAFVWSEATQFRLLDAIAQTNPSAYATQLRQFSDQLYSAYWDNGYRSAAGPSARFYDDNAHVVVSLMDAYRVTHDPVYLDRAKQTQAFVVSGSDVSGGIKFQESTPAGNSDAISTLQGARGAAMIYRATADNQYLNDAQRLLTWANSHIQYPDGLFYQRYSITGGPNDIPLINSAGIGISTNLELYQATKDRNYLVQAEYIATRTLTRYFNNQLGRINDPGYWSFELVDAFNELTDVGGNPFWDEKMGAAMTWLHNNKRDSNGHYDTVWGGAPQTTALNSWELNDQASVAVSYLYTGGVGGIATPEIGDVVPEPSSAAATCGATLVLLSWRLRRFGVGSKRS